MSGTNEVTNTDSELSSPGLETEDRPELTKSDWIKKLLSLVLLLALVSALSVANNMVLSSPQPAKTKHHEITGGQSMSCIDAKDLLNIRMCIS